MNCPSCRDLAATLRLYRCSLSAFHDFAREKRCYNAGQSLLTLFLECLIRRTARGSRIHCSGVTNVERRKRGQKKRRELPSRTRKTKECLQLSERTKSFGKSRFEFRASFFAFWRAPLFVSLYFPASEPFRIAVHLPRHSDSPPSSLEVSLRPSTKLSFLRLTFFIRPLRCSRRIGRSSSSNHGRLLLSARQIPTEREIPCSSSRSPALVAFAGLPGW